MAQDYSNLELNENLKNQNSPSAGTSNYMTTQDIDSQVEGISASKIIGGNIRTVFDLGHNNPSGVDPYIRFNGTNDTIVLNNGTNDLITLDAANSRMLFTDGTNNRMFFGNNNGTVAMKLSQVGNNVLTAADNDLIWSSDFNMFKITKIGTVTFSSDPGAGNSLLGTFTHNLGYIPTVIAAGSSNTGFVHPLPLISFVSGDYLNYFIEVDQVTGTIARVQFTRGTGGAGGNAPFTIRMYFMRETSI